MLLRNSFFPNFKSKYCFYQHDHPKFKQWSLNWTFIIPKFWDLKSFHSWKTVCSSVTILGREFSMTKSFQNLQQLDATKKISVICVKHNLFQQSKWSRTIDLNTTRIILFRSPRDIQQINYVGKQLSNTNFLKDSYDLATKQPFGHLLIDLDPKTTNSLRYCSNFVPPGTKMSICRLPKL